MFFSNQQRLLLHLSYIKFPFIDTQCKYNFIEVYEQFFLTDRLEVHPGTKTSARGRFSVSSLHVPKVIRACNKPYLNPITHTLGRGVVRLLSSSYQMLQETDEMVLLQTVRDEGPAGEADVTLSLPELTLVYTELGKDQLSGLNLDGILCVAEKLLCDNHTNCPNGEDEDECPRAIGDLDRVLTHQAKLYTSNEDESALTTTIVASVNEKSSADDEFPHHTWIIVGLLGFCAMCGMLSAGVTLVKRAKKTKQGSMSGMCNKVFFESESSIMTTLEGGTALRLQTGNNESPMKLQNSGVDGNVPMGPCTGPLVETATCADDVFKKDAGWCSSSCLTKQDRSHGSSERKARRSRSLPNSKNDEPHQNCKKESGELKSDDNRTDRNSRISVNGKRSPSSPVLDRIKSSQSSVSNFLRLPRDFEESESCLMSQGSRRSTAASFGNLPNTVVFPVEKLSDVVYHCTDPKGLALNRAWWNRSVPLPLVAESGARIIQGQCPSERIQETHSVSGNDSDKWNTGELKQKHFRGGAPKRPRYSIDPVNEPHTSGETDTVGKIFTYRGRPINATHATKASVWTSSFSTSGELVDDSQPDSHSLPQKSTGYRLREPSGNWAYSYQRATHLAAEEWGKVIEPDSDSSNTRLKLSSYNVDEDKLISRGVHHHHRCPTSETIPNALVSVQCDKTKRISDTINPILTHGRALPCNCRFGGTKFAFPSSLSVTDQKTLERRHRMSDRKTSLDDFRVNQCDESETASSQQNSEDTETESRSEDRQDTVGKIFTYRGRPINATHATKASVWTSSFSTSGELVDDSQPDSHSLPQKSTGYRLREPSGNWAYSYQRAAHLAAEEWGKVIEPDSDSSNTRLKLSSYNVDEDKLISRGVHHHHRCPTSETIPNALVSVQCDKTKRISDTINPILTHGRALPCNCRFGGTKFAFPSSLSVTDQKTLERRHRMSDRKTSLDDFRVNQCDESETASSQQNSEDTETESRSEDRQDAAGRLGIKFLYPYGVVSGGASIAGV
ncbi:hypothetical protein T265_10996 [Opisthorchis viverrini]|uniref:Uncharacterized protein n=1 Tax=Opisthorchis viverrini TaxID=6198 RepID=A0A074Z0J0_OPIVI|nr:hypothetical protein T265_10996 [Opisthorchis viverrini]KER20463.1 hypothetical protein T265_10996 [Opisthorchis viverrini]